MLNKLCKNLSPKNEQDIAQLGVGEYHIVYNKYSIKPANAHLFFDIQGTFLIKKFAIKSTSSRVLMIESSIFSILFSLVSSVRLVVALRYGRNEINKVELFFVIPAMLKKALRYQCKRLAQPPQKSTF